MKRSTPLIIIAVVVLVGIASAITYGVMQQKDSADTHDHSTHQHESSTTETSSSNGTDSSEAVETNTVEISNFDYSPKTIRVKKGTKVTWTNQDGVQHNVVGDDLDALNGPLLDKGQSYSYTFDTVGTFSYHCAPHPYMKGTVIVTE